MLCNRKFRSQISFSHRLLFDFFAILKILAQFFQEHCDNKTSLSTMASPFVSILVFFITFLVTSNGQDCGRVKVSGSLTIGSEHAVRGQWPWLVPLLRNESDKFFCGSTIVSEKHLLTGENGNSKKTAA
jgi:hypothetical protein